MKVILAREWLWLLGCVLAVVVCVVGVSFFATGGSGYYNVPPNWAASIIELLGGHLVALLVGVYVGALVVRLTIWAIRTAWR